MAASASLHMLRTRFETTDVDHAMDVLSGDYSQLSGALRANGTRSRCVVTGSEMAGCAIREIQFNWDGQLDVEPIPGVCVVELLDGEYETAADRHRIGLRRDVPVMFGSRAHHQGRIACPVTRTVQLDDAVLAAAVGLPPGDMLVFRFAEPISPAWTRYWTATRRHVMEAVLNDPVTSASALCVSQAVRMLAVAAAQAFPHTRTAVATHGSAGAGSFRRAVAFIDDRACEPITMADIATAARASADDVRAAFRRHLDTTPMRYLRRVRLTGTHKDLRAATLGGDVTVDVIAARWGFTHLAGFTEYYREQYGCLPSETLRS
nr:helix-turn-helix transcriptional regulator [Kibdelosporangium sp. MJ126-NF4]CEL18628.1 Transcriptional regulator, AraC family [Kibdelosporangium sp. MJ126-NF4]CTQ98113.1 Transcriptional regulator, AraC family [Kibdelosporangium sp. MJ126-NF4]